MKCYDLLSKREQTMDYNIAYIKKYDGLVYIRTWMKNEGKHQHPEDIKDIKDIAILDNF